MKKLIFSIVLAINVQTFATEPVICPSAKEFITTREYLNDHSELGLNESEILDTSRKVAAGCAGAASRFTKAFTILSKTEGGSRGSLRVAVELSQKSENYTTAFLEIFKKSYLSEYLDLDYNTSLQMARSLSVDFAGEPERAQKDFVDLVAFCTDEKYLALSKPICGQIAGRVVKATEQYNAPIASEFISLFEFIVSEKGPTPDLVKAIEVAEQVIMIGPEAAANFKTAYRYAIQDDGLAYTAKDSLQFAMEIGGYAKFDPEKHRMPASQFKTLEDL